MTGADVRAAVVQKKAAFHKKYGVAPSHVYFTLEEEFALLDAGADVWGDKTLSEVVLHGTRMISSFLGLKTTWGSSSFKLTLEEV